MSRVRLRYHVIVAVAVLAVFATVYAWVAPFEDPTQRFDAYLWIAAAFAIPTMLWLAASLVLVDHWWTSVGRLATIDAPGRLLASAVASLPEPRQRWAEAMLGELAQVHGRKARWRFALSCVRALFFLPIRRGRRGLPGRLAVPAASTLVTGAVAVCVVSTVVFVRQHPDAIDGLSPGRIVLLAVVLTACLCLAAGPPRRPARSPVTAHLGVGGAFVFAVGLLAAIHAKPNGLAAYWLLFGPMLTFFVPAILAAAHGGSFRTGVRAGIWTAITVMPLTFALLLVEASRQYARDGSVALRGRPHDGRLQRRLRAGDPRRHPRHRFPVRRHRRVRRSAARRTAS